jgi:hypothetical protein
LFLVETAGSTPELSDLSVRMHAAHTSDALYLAFQVRDQYVRANAETAYNSWLNDSVEIFLDGDRVPRASAY